MSNTHEQDTVRRKAVFREGDLRLGIYEVQRDGEPPRCFFTLTRQREGRRETLLTGWAENTSEIREKVTALRKELARERETSVPGRAGERIEMPWYPAGRPVALRPDGALIRVEKSFPSPHEAELFTWQKPLGFFEKPVSREYKKGDIILARYGDGRKLDLLIDRFRWKQEVRGKYFTFGRWYDRSHVPERKELVNIETELNYQNKVWDHRITPRIATRTGRDPGEPEKPMFVVVQRHEKLPGVGVIVDITPDRAEAVKIKAHREKLAQAHRQVLEPSGWKRLSLKPEPGQSP